MLTLRHSGDAFAASVSHGTQIPPPPVDPRTGGARATPNLLTPPLPPPPLPDSPVPSPPSVAAAADAAAEYLCEKLTPRQSQRPRLRERAILSSRFDWAAKRRSTCGWLTATCLFARRTACNSRRGVGVGVVLDCCSPQSVEDLITRTCIVWTANTRVSIDQACRRGGGSVECFTHRGLHQWGAAMPVLLTRRVRGVRDKHFLLPWLVLGDY